MRFKLTMLFAFTLLFITACSNNDNTRKERHDDESVENSDDKDKPGKEKGQREDGVYDDDEEGTSLQGNPGAVVKALFTAAKSKDFSSLSQFCNEDADGDCLDICDLENHPEKQEEFIEYFENGKVQGKPEINGNEAKVNIMFGPDGTKKETINMIKSKGKWYLESF